MAAMPDDESADPKSSYAELQRRLAEAVAERDEALDRENAAAEVLQIINSSPGDLGPVFDAILEKAHSLGGASRGTLFLLDGEVFRAAASHGYPEELPGRLRTIAVSEDPRLAALVAGEPLVHVPDLRELDDPVARAVAERGGVRTNLLVPLRKGGTLLGVLSCNRTEVRRFSEKQVALLQNFAAQAVVAMENARLLTETRDALDQQTATAEILGVINSSPGDLAPVFDAMLDRATQLSQAAFGLFQIYDGQHFHNVAQRGVPGQQEPVEPTPGMALHRIVAGEQIVQVSDLADTDLYRSGNPQARRLVDTAGARTALWVALRKEKILLGTMVIYRQEIRPFSEKQIGLLENFAAQAVIAIENARLITETREALEHETATAEILGVINSSPGHLAPVFDAMLEKAIRLCEAAIGVLWLFAGDRLDPTAWRGVPMDFADFLSETATVPGPGTAAYRFLKGGERSVIQTLDLADEEAYRTGDPLRVSLVDLGGARTALHVPLCKAEAVLGVMTVYRQEVKPFSDKQIALLQNFAAQAVIAMENARLITDTREALEQQTATAEVLRVISSSPTDVQPTFDAIVARAAVLCEAEFSAVARFDDADGLLHLVATNNLSPEEAAAFHSIFPRLRCVIS